MYMCLPFIFGGNFFKIYTSKEYKACISLLWFR